MKTSELTGAALDWAVMQCEGQRKDIDFAWWTDDYSPSTNWAQGGAIIEREKLDVFCSGSVWDASTGDRHPNVVLNGPTPLIAAMRCYVSSKLGGEVEIPAELLEGETK